MEWAMETNSLADQVIQANEVVEKSGGDDAPDGYYTDDLGWWVEQDIRKDKVRFARYIYTRCRKLNPHLYTRDGDKLFNSHKVVNKNSNDISELADIPELLATPTAVWVYKRLLADVPKFDPDRILVADGMVWNMKTCEFEEWDVNDYTTVS